MPDPTPTVEEVVERLHQMLDGITTIELPDRLGLVLTATGPGSYVFIEETAEQAALLLSTVQARVEEVDRDKVGSALVAGLDAHAANVYRHAPVELSNEEARAWYRGYDTRTDVRPDPVPLAQTPMGKALSAAESQLEGARKALEEIERATTLFGARSIARSALSALQAGEGEAGKP